MKIALPLAAVTLFAVGVNALADRNALHGHALDGDTFVVRSEHIRIEHIDAPELPGHCRGWRKAHDTCAKGDPWAAKRGLQNELDRGVFCHRDGKDFYGRTLATCVTRDGADLGQLLVNAGLAQPYTYGGK